MTKRLTMENVMNKPYSESCDQNREPILSVLKPLLSTHQTVLEIGSGTGQHAVYFAKHMPHLNWLTSDCKPYLQGIKLWVDESALDNVKPPFELDVTTVWPDISADCIFTANSIHIMSNDDVIELFNGVGHCLTGGGLFICYGPFNYNQSYTSESNARFDIWLKTRDKNSGIKHFETISELASRAGLNLINDLEMPANNRILVWKSVY